MSLNAAVQLTDVFLTGFKQNWMSMTQKNTLKLGSRFTRYVVNGYHLLLFFFSF